MILLHTCGKPASWDTWVHEEYLSSDWQEETYREVNHYVTHFKYTALHSKPFLLPLSML